MLGRFSLCQNTWKKQNKRRKGLSWLMISLYDQQGPLVLICGEAEHNGSNETGVLDWRPKLPRFHMPGPDTSSWTANKVAWWRQREEIDYIAPEGAEKALISSSVIFGVQTWALCISRQKNYGQGTKIYIVKQSQSQVCSGCSLSQSKDSRGIPEKMLLLALFEGTNLVP
jgi:hypothetical protein